MSEYHYNGDPLGWAKTSLERNAAFRKTIEDAREHPYYATRIDEGMKRARRHMEIALKFNVPEKAVEIAEASVMLLREARPLFDYVYEYIDVAAHDDDTNDYVRSLTEPERSDDDALGMLLREQAINCERIASFLQRHREYAVDAGLRTLQCAHAASKLRKLASLMPDAPR